MIMGDPRKLKKKYETPRKVLDADRIKDEHKLRSDYGLRNTREVWTALQELKKVRREARRLLSLGERGKDEAQPIMAKLVRLGIIKEGTRLEDLLTLTVRDFLERRLQTIVVRRKLAKSMSQARQLITHGFIAVNGRKATVPSHLVMLSEEPSVSYFRGINIELGEEEGEKPKRRPRKEAEAAEAAPTGPEAPKAE
jgi:small subunit ribosomal protein S4